MQCRQPTEFEQKIYPVKGPHPEPQESIPRIQTVGTFKSNGNFFWEQISSGISLHYIRGGTGVFEVDGACHTVSEGEVFLFWPGQHIRYWDLKDSPWRYTWMFISGSETSWVLREAGLHREVSHIYVQNIPRFSRAIDEIVTTFKSGEYSPLYPTHSVLALLDLLGDLRGLHNDISEHPGDKIRKLIDSNHLGISTVSELSEALGVDRSTVYRAFRSRYGISVKEYIEESRMDKAQGLLRLSQASVKEVAYACAFGDWRQFSRSFKKRFGSSPSIWRAQHGRGQRNPNA